MPKFRLKRVVEAHEWQPGRPVAGVTEVVLATDTAGGGPTVTAGYGHCITIDGHEVRVNPGDWVITEGDGVHHRPCAAAEFARTYEPADEHHP